jgi:hypothetical protein
MALYMYLGMYMVDFQKISCNFCAPAHAGRIRQDFVELGAFELISAFATYIRDNSYRL